MPTYDVDPRFWQDWAHLTDQERQAFLGAMRQMVTARRPFRAGLRMKGYQGRTGVFEMTWARDGRELFRYGSSPRGAEAHVIWLRIETHDILRRP